MLKASEIAALAESGYLLGMPYSRYDCQGYVKALLKKLGSPRKWIGTNDMWRNHFDGRYLIRDYPEIPRGAILLKCDYTEKAPSRYKSDPYPNCKHCGVYTGNDTFYHSTTGGVQKGSRMTIWTHWAMLKDIDYTDSEIVDASNSWCVTFPEVGEGKVKKLLANKVKVTWVDEDGTEHYEVLELSEDPENVTSIEAYYKETT